MHQNGASCTAKRFLFALLELQGGLGGTRTYQAA
jgi:hypothetical protein